VAFNLPGFDKPAEVPQPAEAPADDVEVLIRNSVARFEKRFDNMGMLTIARVSGWIADYEREIRELVKAAQTK